MQRKPNINNPVDDFINGAKDEKLNPDQDNKRSLNDDLSLENILTNKPKTFPLSLPPALHKAAAEMAARQFPKISLHDFILVAIKEKIERD